MVNMEVTGGQRGGKEPQRVGSGRRFSVGSVDHES